MSIVNNNKSHNIKCGGGVNRFFDEKNQINADNKKHNSIKPVLAAWTADETWLNKAFTLAQGKDAVSFDIFDTALTRDVDSPFDIFARAEKYLLSLSENFIGFAIAREQAEEAARVYVRDKRGFGEITYDEIYEQLPYFIKLSKAEIAQAKERELIEESRALCAVPDILRCSEKLAEAGITYIFVSDMYLPQSFLSKILAREGYKNWQEIIVSSEVRRTKAAGDIWHIPALRGKTLLHIGDNKKSDVKIPRWQTGGHVETLLYPRAQGILRWGGRLEPAVLPFSEAHRAAALAARVNPDYSDLPEAERDAKELYCLGQSFGAVILGSFIFWLLRRARQNNIGKIFFCARDGWLMLKAWEILTKNSGCGIQASYIYASRKVLTYARGAIDCTPQEISPFMLDFLVQRSSSTVNADIIKRLNDLSPETAAKAAALLGRPNADFRGRKQRRLRALLADESVALYKGFCAWNKKVSSYLEQEGVPQAKNAAMVDMGWHGTMQNGLVKICRNINPQFSIMGFYYGLWPRSIVNRYESGAMEAAFFNEFIPAEDEPRLAQAIGMLEDLHTAPEGSCVDFADKSGKWEPVIPQTDMDIFNQSLLSPFVKGTLAALEKLAETGKTMGGIRAEDLTPQSGLSAIYRLILSPSANEVQALGKIRHSAIWGHTDYHYIRSLPQPWLKHKALRLFHSVEWRSGLWAEWRGKKPSHHRKHILRKLRDQEFTYLTPREKRFFF